MSHKWNFFTVFIFTISLGSLNFSNWSQKKLFKSGRSNLSLYQLKTISLNYEFVILVSAKPVKRESENDVQILKDKVTHQSLVIESLQEKVRYKNSLLIPASLTVFFIVKKVWSLLPGHEFVWSLHFPVWPFYLGSHTRQLPYPSCLLVCG